MPGEWVGRTVLTWAWMFETQVSFLGESLLVDLSRTRMRDSYSPWRFLPSYLLAKVNYRDPVRQQYQVHEEWSWLLPWLTENPYRSSSLIIPESWKKAYTCSELDSTPTRGICWGQSTQKWTWRILPWRAGANSAFQDTELRAALSKGEGFQSKIWWLKGYPLRVSLEQETFRVDCKGLLISVRWFQTVFHKVLEFQGSVQELLRPWGGSAPPLLRLKLELLRTFICFIDWASESSFI